jgi:hypothetical protein
VGDAGGILGRMGASGGRSTSGGVDARLSTFSVIDVGLPCFSPMISCHTI